MQVNILSINLINEYKNFGYKALYEYPPESKNAKSENGSTNLILYLDFRLSSLRKKALQGIDCAAKY